MFGISALYHKATWSPAWRQWLRRLDHATIFLTIAAPIPHIAGLALPPGRRFPCWPWSGARADGRHAATAARHTVRWLAVGPYLALGWTAVVWCPQLFDRLGVAGFGC